MLFIRSLNVGVPREVSARSGFSGIGKRPVEGSVLVQEPLGAGSGVAGDHICDQENHGGIDQAVYAYAREDLDRWEAELGRPLADGVFGENLTTHGRDINEALVGERWRIGGALLQVTVPRIPCRTFADWLETRGWVRTFTQRAVPGVYFRVLEPGHVSSGDAVTVEHRPDHDASIRTVFRALTTQPELLAPLAGVEDMPEGVRERARRRTGVELDEV